MALRSSCGRIAGVAATLPAVLLMSAQGLRAQTITTEAAATTGYSTEGVGVLAAQVRALGGVKGGIRYFAEGAWAQSSGDGSEAFAAAYPYVDRVRLIEAYGERIFRPGRGLAALRVGRYRTPFGIYQGSEYAYVGLLRAPLIRNADYFALSNDFLEHGIDLMAGVPQATLEASMGAPAGGADDSSRRSTTDYVMRVQSYYGPLILGASYIRTSPYAALRPEGGRAAFSGADVRMTFAGVQLRGEWLTGNPFSGATSRGWYTDIIVHERAMGPVTAVARIEQVKSTATRPFALDARRQTVGARIRLLDRLAVQVNVLDTSNGVADGGGGLVRRGTTALDVGFTIALRRG